MLRALNEAGATLLPSACGACAGYGSSIPEGSTVDLVDRAQLQGPHGRGDARRCTWLALHRRRSAVRGAITDPREMLASRPRAATDEGPV